MNINRLIKQLKIDEGASLTVYLDHLGYKTVGIGHLIKDTDPEWLKKLNVGDKITEVQQNELFVVDMSLALQDAMTIFHPVWEQFPDEVQEVFINMLFNLGRPRFLGFKKMILAAHNLDWAKVSVEMMDSKWAKQVPNRAARLKSKIDAFASSSAPTPNL